MCGRLMCCLKNEQEAYEELNSNLWAIFGLFAEPDKFTFTDSLLLIMILVNVFNSIKELIRNKRIAAEKNAAETSEDAPVAK